jgi:hypothetical protein
MIAGQAGLAIVCITYVYAMLLMCTLIIIYMKKDFYQFDSELDMFRIRRNKATIVYRGLKQTIVAPNWVLHEVRNKYLSGTRFPWLGYYFSKFDIEFLNECNFGVATLRKFRLEGHSCPRFAEFLMAAIESNSGLIAEDYSAYFDERYNMFSFTKLRYVNDPVFIGSMRECVDYCERANNEIDHC